MSTKHGDDTNAAYEALEWAYEEYLEARYEWLRQFNLNQGSAPSAAVNLHVATMNLYLVLYPYSSDDGISELWTGSTLWTEDGTTVSLDDLDHRVDKIREVREEKRMRSGERVDMQVDRLSPERCLKAGMALCQIARKLGIDVEADANSAVEV